MSSETEALIAEQHFRQTFERLKVNRPKALPKDTLVSQNNVAQEASCDLTALRKSRFPTLVRGTIANPSARRLSKRARIADSPKWDWRNWHAKGTLPSHSC